MSLTKKEAISWHRRMWLWIAKEIARNKEIMDILDLKYKFCLVLNNQNLTNYCYCCDYAKQEWIDCRLCPLIWGEDENLKCEQAEYAAIYHCTSWKRQAKLAYRIAMLPERENL